jgi:hypothetical protein
MDQVAVEVRSTIFPLQTVVLVRAMAERKELGQQSQPQIEVVEAVAVEMELSQ